MVTPFWIDALTAIALVTGCGGSQSSTGTLTTVATSPPSEVESAAIPTDGLANAEVSAQQRPTQITLCPGTYVTQHERVADAPPPCRHFRWDDELNQYFVDNHPIELAQAEEVLRVYSSNFVALGLQDVHGHPHRPHQFPPSMHIVDACPVSGLTPCVLFASTAHHALRCPDDDGNGIPDSPELCSHYQAYSEAFRAVWEAVLVHATDYMGPVPRL